MRAEQLLSKLENVRKSPNGWTCRCPAHEDKQNSLSVGVGEDDKILLKCFAGCESEQIVKALNLELSDLMPEVDNRQKPIETAYNIEIGPGDIVTHLRVDYPDGSKKFFWKRNGQSGLGGLRINDIPLWKPEKQGNDERVTICEGEKSCIAANKLGLRAWATVSGANGCPSENVLKSVCSEQSVIIWADNDKPGLEHASKLESKIKAFSKNVTIITTGGEKDDAADYKGTLADLEKIISEAKKKCEKPPQTRRIAEGVGEAIAELIKFSHGDYSGRIPTGIESIDRALMGGFMPGAMYLLGALSGGGKTTLLQQFGIIGAKYGDVLFISPEMTVPELTQREIIKRSGFDVFSVAPWIAPDQRVTAEKAHKEASEQLMIENPSVHILENIEASIFDIEAEAARFKNLKMIILDYAQELADNNPKLARYLAVGDLGKDAIKLGRKFKCPVILASQLNATKEGKNDVVYTFRESSKLEHKANTVMIMEVKWGKTANPQGFYEIEEAKIFSTKNRGGYKFEVLIDYKPNLYQIQEKKKPGFFEKKYKKEKCIEY